MSNPCGSVRSLNAWGLVRLKNSSPDSPTTLNAYSTVTSGIPAAVTPALYTRNSMDSSSLREYSGVDFGTMRIVPRV